MTSIIDISTGLNFDLPEKIGISVHKTSPFEITQGSITLPIKLPWTKKNIKLLRFPDRIESVVKPNKTFEVTIMTSLYQRKGTMNILRIVSEKYIETTVVFEESAFYATCYNTMINDLFTEIRDDFDVETNGIEQARLDWIDYLQDVTIGKEVDDFFVFEVLSRDNLSGTDFTLLNRLEYPSQKVSGNIYCPTLYNRTGKIINITLDGEPFSLSVLPGHNITPFLKLNYVLTELFSKLGYTLDKSELEANPHFGKMTVLNNTADSILTGVLKYSQLLPTCTIAAFLKSISVLMGCTFEIIGNQAKIVLWKSTLNLSSHNYTDFSKYLSQQPELTPINPTSLKLTSKAKFEQLTYIIPPNPYPGELDPNEYIGAPDEEMPSGSVFPVEWIDNNFYQYFDKTEQEYFIMRLMSNVATMMNYALPPLTGAVLDLSGLDQQKLGEYNGADFDSHFRLRKSITRFQKDNDAEYQSGNFPDVKSFDSDHAALTEVNESLIGETVSPSQLFPKVSIGEVRRLNSQMMANDELSSVEDIKAECPIMFAFQRREVFPEYTEQGPAYGIIFFGSLVHVIMSSNGDISEMSLRFSGEFGIFNWYYQELAQMLEKSCFEVKTNLNLPETELDYIDKGKPILIKGQPLLPLSLKFEFKNDSLNIHETTFRTMRNYILEEDVDENELNQQILNQT